jgi:hypothetical protein
MADMPKSSMIVGALPPSALGAPLSRDRDKPLKAQVTWMRAEHLRFDHIAGVEGIQCQTRSDR